MLTAGDLIDNTLGVKFGLATLTAAACGQVVRNTRIQSSNNAADKTLLPPFLEQKARRMFSAMFSLLMGTNTLVHECGQEGWLLAWSVREGPWRFSDWRVWYRSLAVEKFA